MADRSPRALLSRRDTALAIAALGLPMSEATLATKASRGGGPPYRVFGRTALYQWGDVLKWTEEQTITKDGKPATPPQSQKRCTTAEHKRNAR